MARVKDKRKCIVTENGKEGRRTLHEMEEQDLLGNKKEL